MEKKTKKKFLKSKKRLKFIDMARSIAILLMLKGHFIDDSLILEVRDPNNIIYSTWWYIRGFTAPIFLTVTGLIFVFLLLKNKNESFFSNLRVRKGFKRIVELFFWGWILQWYAFHVLECIAVGILFILIIYGIYKLIKIIPLWIFFFMSGFICFAGFLYLSKLPKGMPWPEDAYYMIQNAFHGPSNKSIFPIIPWMGYTMFGAMIGAIIYDFKKYVLHIYFPIMMILLGLSLFIFSDEILQLFDIIVNLSRSSFEYKFIRLNWLYEKMGMVLIALGILIIIDILIGNRIKSDSLFLKIGQNTLTIYIIHMIILYGSIIRIGINDFYHKQLNPWEAIMGALLFIITFIILIKYIDWIKIKLSFILNPT